jgi:hypothetical protein
LYKAASEFLEAASEFLEAASDFLDAASELPQVLPDGCFVSIADV